MKDKILGLTTSLEWRSLVFGGVLIWQRVNHSCLCQDYLLSTKHGVVESYHYHTLKWCMRLIEVSDSDKSHLSRSYLMIFQTIILLSPLRWRVEWLDFTAFIKIFEWCQSSYFGWSKLWFKFTTSITCFLRIHRYPTASSGNQYPL